MIPAFASNRRPARYVKLLTVTALGRLKFIGTEDFNMRHKLAMIFAVAIGLFMISTSLFAHHGNAAYETDKKVSVSGTVTEWLWANPHCFLKIDGKNDKGEPTHWIVETSNPQDMARLGWARNSFKPGDEVTLTIVPSKNERSIGRFVGKDNFLLNGKPFPPVDKQ